MAPPPVFPGMQAAMGVSPKSKMTAALLAFFLGSLGIHRFYAGKTGTGIVLLLLTIIGYVTIFVVVGYFLLSAVGIWVLIDFIMILMGKFKDKNGLLITK
jgi:TM2 domain-containing membrane protein YozV